MDKDAQQIIAAGIAVALILFGMGQCARGFSAPAKFNFANPEIKETK